MGQAFSQAGYCWSLIHNHFTEEYKKEEDPLAGSAIPLFRYWSFILVLYSTLTSYPFIFPFLETFSILNILNKWASTALFHKEFQRLPVEIRIACPESLRPYFETAKLSFRHPIQGVHQLCNLQILYVFNYIASYSYKLKLKKSASWFNELVIQE